MMGKRERRIDEERQKMGWKSAFSITNLFAKFAFSV